MLRHSTRPYFVCDGFLEIGSPELLFWAVFKLKPPDLCLLSS
jgi:hypothetical protein